MGSRGRIERSRARVLALLLVAALVCTALVPAVAAAAAGNIEGGNSFNELSQKAQEPAETTPTTATTPTQNNSTPTNSGKTLVIVLGAAVVLLSAITFVIVRDARRVAPAGDGDLVDIKAPGRTVRQRKRRAKAKAAKQQRKRHR
jgi:hypothetical protein